MRILSLIITLLFSLPVFAGHEVNNGGDIIWCPKISRFYALDFAVAIDQKENRERLRRTKILKTSFDMISKILHEKVPTLSDSFDEFVSLLDNEDNSTRKYIWKPMRYNLPEVADESIYKLPTSCASSGFGVAEVYQAVVRKDLGNRVIFYYNPAHFGKLDATQMSFLLVHEWLWNYVQNSAQNTKVNFFLHSKDFEEISSDEVVKRLEKLGLNKILFN